MMHSVFALPQIVIYSGIGLSVVPAITLLFFDDDKCLKEEEEGDDSSAEEEDAEDAAGVHTATATCALFLCRAARVCSPRRGVSSVTLRLELADKMPI